MKNALNPYGQGNSAKFTVDAIEKSYKEGLLYIKSPEEVINSFKRKMTLITEYMTVNEFEIKMH